MKSTEDLIKDLSSSHLPVSRDKSPFIRLILFLYTYMAMIALLLYLMSPYTFSVQNFQHGIELLSLFLFISAATYLGFQAFVPGENKKRTFVILVLSLIVLTYSFIQFLFSSHTPSQGRNYCEFEALGISILTVLIAHNLIKRNNFAIQHKLSYLLFLSIPLSTTLLMHGICNVEKYHVLKFHLLSSLLVPILYLLISYHLNKESHVKK